MSKQKLNAQQRLFVHHLAADPRVNQEAAAIKAGYSPKSARFVASRLMNEERFAHVRAEFERILEKRLDKYNVSADRIEHELSIIAFGDRSRISWKENGKVMIADTGDLFPDERVMVDSYREKSKNDGSAGTIIEVNTHSKVDALKTLAKIRGMLKERHEVDLTVSIATSRALESDIMGSLAKLAAARSADMLPASADAQGEEEPGEDILGGLAKLAALRGSASMGGEPGPGPEAAAQA